MIVVAATTFRPWVRCPQCTSMKILGATRIPTLMLALLSITPIPLHLIREIDLTLHLIPIFLLSPTVVAVLATVINSPKAYRLGNKLCTAPHFLKEKGLDVTIITSMRGPRENLMLMTIASRTTNRHLGHKLLKLDHPTDSTPPTSVWVLPITERVPTTGVANQSAKVTGI